MEDKAPAGAAAPSSPARHKWLIAFAVVFCAALELLDTSIVNVALPYMEGTFSVSRDQITWVLTSYLVSSGIMIPLTGWLSARFGRKRYFMFSVFMFLFASWLCGVAQSLDQMVFFRLFQGAAGAAMIPTSQAILMETFAPEERQMAMAAWGLGLMVAPVMGPVVGGWITYNWSWRWNFYINLPIGAAASLMVYTFVHDPSYLKPQRRAQARIDYLGIAFLALSLGALQMVLDRGERSDWFAAPWVWYLTLTSAVSAVLLVVHELRFSAPVLDLTVFRIREFSLSALMLSLLVVVLYGANLMNPLFLQELMGYTAWNAGLAVASRGLGVAASMILVGQLARTGVDTRFLTSLGFLLLAWSSWQMSQWDTTVSASSIQLPILLMGVGSGMVFPFLASAALSSVAPARMGFATSLYNMLRNTGSAIGVSMVSNLLERLPQVHQSYLVEHVTPFVLWRLSSTAPRMPGAPKFNFPLELATGQKQGLGLLLKQVEGQALLLSFNDVYRLLALVALLMVPWALLFRRGAAGASSAGAH